MNIRTINDSLLSEIASAIRAKTGEEELLLPSEMSAKIQSIQVGGNDDVYVPNSDMLWAKQVLIDDTGTNDGQYACSVLQMIDNKYVVSDIVVPSGCLVKTSDGGIYQEDATHEWDDTNARVSENYTDTKMRYIITYYPQEGGTKYLMNNVIYVVSKGTSFTSISFKNHVLLEYFDEIDGEGKTSHTNVAGNFSGCYSLRAVPDVDFSKFITFEEMFNNCKSLTYIPKIDTSSGTKFTKMFYGCACLSKIPYLSTGKGTVFSSMFFYCRSLKEIGGLDISSGTQFDSMFSGCESLSKVPNLDTSNGLNFNNMFYGCASLIEIPPLNTSNGTDFSAMFSSCVSLRTIPNLDISNGTKIQNMFFGCSSLEYVPKLQTSKGTSASGMFRNCDMLQKIEQLDFASATNIGSAISSDELRYINMLNIGVSLTLAYIPNLTHDSLINGIFNNLKDLTGSSSQSLTLGDANMEKLTEEEKLIATNKNWILR